MSEEKVEAPKEEKEAKREHEYVVKRTKLGTMFYITTNSGGPIPSALEGEFTSPETAKAFIDAYLVGVKTNAKSRSR